MATTNSRKLGHAFRLTKPFAWLLVAGILIPSSCPQTPGWHAPRCLLDHSVPDTEAPAKPLLSLGLPNSSAACNALRLVGCVSYWGFRISLSWEASNHSTASHAAPIINLGLHLPVLAITDSLVHSLVCSLSVLPLECEIWHGGKLSLLLSATPWPGTSPALNKCLLHGWINDLSPIKPINDSICYEANMFTH